MVAWLQKSGGAAGGGAAGDGAKGGIRGGAGGDCGSKGGGGDTHGPAARMRAAAICSHPGAAVCTQTAATRKATLALALALALAPALALALALLGGRKLS